MPVQATALCQNTMTFALSNSEPYERAHQLQRRVGGGGGRGGDPGARVRAKAGVHGAEVGARAVRDVEQVRPLRG